MEFMLHLFVLREGQFVVFGLLGEMGSCCCCCFLFNFLCSLFFQLHIEVTTQDDGKQEDFFDATMNAAGQGEGKVTDLAS